MPFVEVAVNTGARQTFSYAIPEGMTLVPGDAVFVPFGRQFLQGIVMQVVDVPAFSDPKPVDARIGDAPVVSPERVDLARWLARYYLEPAFACIALMLPPGFERKPRTVYQSLYSAEEIDSLRLSPIQRQTLERLIQKGASTTSQLTGPGLEGTRLQNALTTLRGRGMVSSTQVIPRPAVRGRTVTVLSLMVSEADARDAAEYLRSQRKRRLADALELIAENGGEMTFPELRAHVKLSMTDLLPLAEDGLIYPSTAGDMQRDPLAGRNYEPRPSPPLTHEQATTFQPIREAVANSKAASFLLHGVTGSGKTEIYLSALEETLRQGRRGIVLVPEIALTPQTVRRFAERFPGQVAVLHSGLSQGELYDQWHGINQGRYSVVIGSRSAVFAPQPDLGLIVIDEEHEWTYKQQDQSPRYHARDAALELAKLCSAVLIMGSATPDVVSYQKALWGQHRLVELRQRVRPVVASNGTLTGERAVSGNGAAPALTPVSLPSTGPGPGGEGTYEPVGLGRGTARVITSTDLPPVEVIDMREELKGGNRSIFSRPLQLALYRTVERGEQAILFLNRRGTAGFVQCRDCGFVPQCSACAIPMGYHRQGGLERMLCHQCNRSRRLFERCPMCGSIRLRPMGLGVEAVETGVADLLPNARTLRWDRDVTQGRHSHEQILASFLNGEAEVLIGTQMVAKGLDLPAVTLVGVISADIGLHIPDFRSAERTFQLLTQVAGRAGRTASEDGRPGHSSVVIQTYTPDNYAVIAAAQHDYHAFLAHEIELRQASAYPPFVRLATLTYAHYNAERAQREAARMVKQLRERTAVLGLAGIEVLDAAPPHIPKWHGRSRWQITVRLPAGAPGSDVPTELLRDLQLGEGWSMDIDPASLA